MRIVIDLQGAQTESRNRGIGRYNLSLAQAIARNQSVIKRLNGLDHANHPVRTIVGAITTRIDIRIGWKWQCYHL